MYEPKKSLGQHWLRDQASLQAIVDAADLSAADTVLEIGPGLGTLTAKLLKTKAQVLALELDNSLIPKLQGQYGSSPNFKVEQGDILKFDLSKLPSRYKIVANIPYYLTGNLLRILTQPVSYQPQTAVLLLQKEVAERLAAKPGQMSILAIATQLAYGVRLGQMVPAELFDPLPKVDSQIVILTKLTKPLITRQDHQLLMQVVKAGFAGRRKTMLNSLSAGLQKTKPNVQQALDSAKISQRTRAQDLSLDQWLTLVKSISVVK